VIDVSRLDGVATNAGGPATVGAGARLIDVYETLWRRRRTIPAGSCPTVGIAGLALGGGVGFTTRAFGTTSDNVLAVTLVDAFGRVLTCTPTENGDLYWACRGGGGGNFGIATAFRFRTHAVSIASTFVAHWPWSAAQRVVEAWQTWAPHAPDRLFSVLMVATGGPQIRVAGQLLGLRTELEHLLEPLLDTDPASVSTTERTYMEAALYWAGCSAGSVEQCHLTPEGNLQRTTFTAKSDYAEHPLSPQGIRTMLGWIERRQAQGGSGYLLLDSYGGAINRVAPGATAFAHRNMLFSFQYGTQWSGAAGASGRRWIQGFWRAMRPYVSGAAYVNYIDPDLPRWQRAYYGPNYWRLQAVKKRYDPENRFRFRQSVRLPG
jgi:FAD/FMN-containing dehydrogenase